MTTTNETKEVDLKTMLKWSEEKLIPTANGDRLISKAEPTEEFWALWRANKEKLREVGISVGRYPKDSPNWQVTWWKPLPKAEVEKRNQNIEASRAVDAQITIPGPDGYSYLGYQKAGVRFMLERFGFPTKPRKP